MNLTPLQVAADLQQISSLAPVSLACYVSVDPGQECSNYDFVHYISLHQDTGTIGQSKMTKILPVIPILDGPLLHWSVPMSF